MPRGPHALGSTPDGGRLVGSHGVIRVHLTVCTVDFTVFIVVVTVFLTFVFLNFKSENTGYRYR